MTIDQAIFAESLDALDTSVIGAGAPTSGRRFAQPWRRWRANPSGARCWSSSATARISRVTRSTAARGEPGRGSSSTPSAWGRRPGSWFRSSETAARDVDARRATARPVHSRLDAATLRQLAQATGGAYAALGPRRGRARAPVSPVSVTLPRHAVEERMRKVYTERFEIPLGLRSLACSGARVGERRRRTCRSCAARFVRTLSVNGAAVAVAFAARSRRAGDGVGGRSC